jgi:hypothetical protein
MHGNQLTYVALAALAATGTIVEANEATAQTGASALENLRADLARDSVLRDEYIAAPLKILSRYGIAPDTQIEALAENHGLSVAGNCVCTGCCVTSINT